MLDPVDPPATFYLASNAQYPTRFLAFPVFFFLVILKVFLSFCFILSTSFLFLPTLVSPFCHILSTFSALFCHLSHSIFSNLFVKPLCPCSVFLLCLPLSCLTPSTVHLCLAALQIHCLYIFPLPSDLISSLPFPSFSFHSIRLFCQCYCSLLLAFFNCLC